MLTTALDFSSLLHQQRQYFNTGATRPLAFRLEQLKKLKTLIQEYEPQILQALQQDLYKPNFEGYLTEILAATKEIDYAIKHLPQWIKPRSVPISLETFPGQACIYPDPLGVVLIISPWNYPFGLALSPLVGAIAAGNCAVIKPSELSPATSAVITDLLNRHFPPELIQVMEGDASVSQALLQERFDHIFFTGGTRIGKIVMEAAAKHLTPVTLELGGKTPCIVDREIDLTETAKRIAWGKFLNAGQTCVAPDYLLVQETIQQPLLQTLQQAIEDFYGTNPAESPDYGRIINQRQFDRLVGLLDSGDIDYGGACDPVSRYLAPTLMTNVSTDAPVMAEEIFGPILPILTYQSLETAIAFVNERPKPLALYLFSKDSQKQAQVLAGTSSGGVCINDTIMHLGVTDLPFGGVGPSGMGQYHGKASFDTFSHFKSVLKRPFWLESGLRYPPYGKKLTWVKRLLG
ncbi:aldehyde dehydrogenase [Synechocystis sp. LKSZ1]|uniref:aldehyde dehydrogenase n=1 Tax=Synechocystis sp. LKSZ1 TaxID=3144951 RepID=UPI00336C0EA3